MAAPAPRSPTSAATSFDGSPASGPASAPAPALAQTPTQASDRVIPIGPSAGSATRSSRPDVAHDADAAHPTFRHGNSHHPLLDRRSAHTSPTTRQSSHSTQSAQASRFAAAPAPATVTTAPPTLSPTSAQSTSPSPSPLPLVLDLKTATDKLVPTLRVSSVASSPHGSQATETSDPRPGVMSIRAMSEQPQTLLDREEMQGLKSIREFLKVRTSYDVLPMSFRLIVLDTDLLIKKSLSVLIQNSIVSAPLWDSKTSSFAGLLTTTDYINIIQYYCQFPDEMSKLDQFRLRSLPDIEKAIGALPVDTVSVRPTRPLYEACRRMLKTRSRRIPLVDLDDETGRETVVSVITQYRILKFIAVNNEHNTVLLKRPVRNIGVGTYRNIATATMHSTVLDVVTLMVRHNISCVPIVDHSNHVLNVFEAVDIIPCIQGGHYDELASSVGEALCKRPDEFPGILTCSPDDRLDSIFETIRKSKVHRLIVVDDESRLQGVISLSDILRYVLLHGEEGDE